jgi:serine/threonine protein kinase
MSNLPAKFTEVRALSPGKNAAVFRAKNSLCGRDVFLKRYPIPPSDTGSALREPHMLTELEHENLAKIYGADTLGEGEILLEMELIAGGSFQELINDAVETGVWPSTHTCIHLTSHVAAGLSHLAKKGFVHRDVKPANLLIRKSGSKKEGVVTDLGLASKLDDTGRAFSTRHARIYRPPEVWTGKGYSAKSDVYQLGIVLYQLLGGYLNYDLGNLDDGVLAKRAAEGSILDPSTLGADVDSALRKVVNAATSPESQRYESMADFLVALNNARLQQLDWTYSVTDDGFRIERQKDTNAYRVDVTVAGNRYTVERQQAGPKGVFRRKLPILQVEHADIGSCRKFRKFIEW